jgi:hypothetical protein
MRMCYHAVDDAVTQDMYYGVGSALSLLGFLLMGIAVFVNVVNMVHTANISATAGKRMKPSPTAVCHGNLAGTDRYTYFEVRTKLRVRDN